MVVWMAGFGVLSLQAQAQPAITPDTLIKNNPRTVYWNVKTTGSMRDGTTTTNEGPRGKLIRPTKIQDGSLCHNSGKACYCTPAKFRITPSLESRWHVLVVANERQETSCPSGVRPNGTAESTALSREEARARREAIQAQKRAQREGR
jgi:hypothetical protein